VDDSQCLRGRPVREWFTRIAWRRYYFNESFRVERDAPVEPVGGGNGACHNEEVADVARLDQLV